MSGHTHTEHDDPAIRRQATPARHDAAHTSHGTAPTKAAAPEEHAHHTDAAPSTLAASVVPDARHAGHQTHGAHVDHTGHELVFRNRFWICLLLTVPVLLYSHMLQMWFGFTPPQFPGSDWIGAGFAIVIFVVGGVPFLRMAAPEIRNRKPGMMVLISLAISVAFVYSLVMLFIDPASGFFWEMALLIDVMLLGHWLEMRSVRQAAGALNQLARLLPDTAEQIDDAGNVQTVAAAALRIGDLVLVRPGASVPADGQVEEGESAVNEAMITGESSPVSKRAGDAVIAGTINGDGSLRVRVTATGDETALAGIMRLVEQAQQSKSRTQILADRAAGWLFYIALGAALLTAVAWTAAVGFNVEVVQRVATVLVIACPHALGLAVPLVVSISTTLSARNGLLVRKRTALESAKDLNVIVFDKTGTLTMGTPEPQNLGALSAEDLGVAAALAQASSHPLALSLAQAARALGAIPALLEDIAEVPGHGVQAIWQGQRVRLGRANWVGAEALSVTASYLAVGPRAPRAIEFSDRLRPGAAEAVAAFQAQGKRVMLISGDVPGAVSDMAARLGITDWQAEALPQDKSATIEALQAQGHRVLMVGDGLNDTVALTAAHVSISPGSALDAARVASDIVLLGASLAPLPEAQRVSVRAVQRIRENFAISFGYNIIAVPIALVGLASPLIAALAMSVSSITVALNALRLK